MNKLYQIIFFCFIGIQSISAQEILNEKLILKKKEGTLKEVLHSISKQNNIVFSYASNVIDDSREVKIPIKFNDLNEILPYLFDEQNVEYKFVERKIILYPRQSKPGEKKQIIHLKGSLVDTETKEIIPFGAIQIKNRLIGVSSNADGIFELKLGYKYKNDTLIFSCLGYRNKELLIKKILEAERLVVELNPELFTLDEITVKPVQAIEIVNNAVAAIPKNYPQKKTQFEGFYRNILQKNGKYVRLTEAACNFQSASYTDTIDKYERQKDYYSIFAHRPNYNTSIYESFYNYYDAHIAEKDKVEIIESRISKDYSRSLSKKYFTGGPLTCLASDKVKLRTDFLNPDKYKYYRYTNKGTTSYDRREVYIISFKPKKIQFRFKGKDYRKKVFTRKPKNAEMQGDLYIDTHSFAFVRISYKVELKSKSPITHNKMINNKTLIDYKLINGKWYLWNVDKVIGGEYKSIRKSQEWDYFESRSKIMVSAIDTLAEKEFDDSKCKPHNMFYSLYRDEHEYNPIFWKDYNGMLPSEEDKKIITDLGKHTSLENQFQMAQKYDSTLKVPLAMEKSVYDTLHGEVRHDPYRWMENKGSDSLIDFLADQNIYADNYAIQYKKESDEVITEIEQWFQPNRISNSFKKAGYVFYEKQAEFDDYPKVFRKIDSIGAKEELILDVNKLAENKQVFYWIHYQISNSGNKIMFISDTTGSENFLVQIKDMKTGKILQDSLKNAFSVGWNKQETEVYYLSIDSLYGINELYKHTIGTKQEQDILIFDETRKNYELKAHLCNNNRYIIFNSTGYVYNEIKLYDIEKGELSTIFPVKKNRFVRAKIYKNRLFAHIEEDSLNYITKQDLKENESVRDTIYKTGNTYISQFEIIGDYLVTIELDNAKYSLKLLNLATGKQKIVGNKNEIASYIIYPVDSLGKIFRYRINSLKTGSKLFEFDIEKEKSSLIKESFKPVGFKRSNYLVRQIEIEARDGEMVPITLYYHKKTIAKNINKITPAPLLMSAYGCYGYSQEPVYGSVVTTMLDKGWVFAQAHVRGGRDKGSNWYRKGNLENKLNTYTDVIDCGKALVEKGYTSAELMALDVASAGGVIGGYVINNHPELFSMVIMGAPVTDLVKSLNSNFPMDIAHQEIYGDPMKQDDYNRIKEYSPMENIKQGNYPSVLIECGYNDTRVAYWQAAKYAAHLQKNNTGNNPVILKTYMNAGHGSPNSRTERNRELAFHYGFLIYEITKNWLQP